jgi:hypothetical protein
VIPGLAVVTVVVGIGGSVLPISNVTSRLSGINGLGICKVLSMWSGPGGAKRSNLFGTFVAPSGAFVAPSEFKVLFFSFVA